MGNYPPNNYPPVNGLDTRLIFFPWSCVVFLHRLHGLIRGSIWVYPKIRATLFWGPYNKDPTTKGTKFGFPIFGNSHMYLSFLGL